MCRREISCYSNRIFVRPVLIFWFNDSLTKRILLITVERSHRFQRLEFSKYSADEGGGPGQRSASPVVMGLCAKGRNEVTARRAVICPDYDTFRYAAAARR